MNTMNTVVPILFAIVLLAFFFLLYSFLSFLICSFRLFFHPPGSSVCSFPAITLSSSSRFNPSFINLQSTRRSSLSTTFFLSLFNRFFLSSSSCFFSCVVTTADLSVWHHYPRAVSPERLRLCNWSSVSQGRVNVICILITRLCTRACENSSLLSKDDSGVDNHYFALS